jgi:nicotinamidase-related amidase
VQRAFGVDVPETVAEMCRPAVTAVLVYDAQVGILAHVLDREALVQRIGSVLGAARDAGALVLYVRHVSLPPSALGVAALRTAMAWQRLDRADAVRSPFPPDAAHTQLAAELAPRPDEPVFDELGMSALVGTPVEAVLRDRGVTTLVLVGAVLEIGIEPTARHAADLGFLPVVVDDACGVVEAEAGRRSLATLDHTLLTHRASAADVVAALTGGVDPGP